MAGILYRCIFCDVSHEVSRRSDGPVYLRCPTTYRWAWYDERAFQLAAPSRGGGRGASARSTAGARRRPAVTGRRAGTGRAKAATARRTGRKTAGRSAARRSTARRSSGKRGRR